jgi:hypothetical protein
LIIALLFKTPGTLKPVDTSLWEKVKQMDFIGTALIITSTVCFLLAMEWGGVTKSWGSADMIAVLVIFPVLIIFFALNEWWQGENAQLSFRILKNRIVLAADIFAFL